MQKKYEDTINSTLTDNDLEGIDFPLVTNQVVISGLYELLQVEIA